MLHNENNLTMHIYNAFGNTSYPKEYELVESFQGVSFSREKESLVNAFHGKSWQDIDAKVVIDHAEQLIWFTIEAYCYFLPAIMIAIVNSPDSDSPLDLYTLWELTPPQSRGKYMRSDELSFTVFSTLSPEEKLSDLMIKQQRFDSIVGKLTNAQRKSILLLITALRDNDPDFSEELAHLFFEDTLRFWQMV